MKFSAKQTIDVYHNNSTLTNKTLQQLILGAEFPQAPKLHRGTSVSLGAQGEARAPARAEMYQQLGAVRQPFDAADVCASQPDHCD